MKKQDTQIQRFETQIAGQNLIIETGKIAGQTNGSCTVQLGETLVLATAVLSDESREGVDYLPLLVDYEEKLYAAGKIKGSRFIKREGRAGDEAILASRLIDRAIRPLFDQSIRYDIQVIVTVLSFDQKNDPDVVGLIAAACALTISDIPWAGPIAGVRVGLVENNWVLNPSYIDRVNSQLDLVVAGTQDKVIMLEAGANQVSEDQAFEAIKFGQKYIGEIIQFINTVQKAIGREKKDNIIKQIISSEEQQVEDLVQKYVDENLNSYLFDQPLKTKSERQQAFKNFKEKLNEFLESQNVGKEKREKIMKSIKERAEVKISEMLLQSNKRIDGRLLDEIRPLKSEVGYLPHTHGTGLFSRGETQILSVVTLGSPGEEQILDTMEENDSKKRFFHHYNFPPFSVGDVGPMRGPGRREIGHGALAERALSPVIPEKEIFPYTIRIVSEVLSSNGSSSQASVCAATLSLMDAGVPIKAPVAGVAMGLVSNTDKNGDIKDYKILTDLQDLEDAEGGMDFKVAGTRDGITAIQLDTKTHGLSDEIVKQTLQRAHQGRIEILENMSQAIKQPREKLSPYAPQIRIIQINPEKIREVIGSGGKVINEIIDKTGASIDIEQDGHVFVTADNAESLDKACEWINNIVREVEVNEIFQGKVVKIMDFGAFVQLLPNQDGLVHISEIAPYRINKVEDVLKEGDQVFVKVIKKDDHGKISLSMKNLPENQSLYKNKPEVGKK
ncbi:MAG: polyribonucleotide nucleotidyltransferase [Patescibacteria group bacterium]|nr:polyribonucleotide nucleotidyltransferase [Patescibacteria group bacterium]